MGVWEWLFPVKCIGCNKEGVELCDKCKLRLVRAKQVRVECRKGSIGGRTHKKCCKELGLDAVFKVYRYEGLMQRIIKAVKYRFRQQLLGECVGEYGRRQVFMRVDGVVPVPLHRVRENWRGFNQAMILAEILAESWGVKVLEVVKRRKATRPVAELGKKEREREILGAFELVNMELIKGKRLVVVDDVITTGGTMKEVAKVLKKGGARWVGGWALAG